MLQFFVLSMLDTITRMSTLNSKMMSRSEMVITQSSQKKKKKKKQDDERGMERKVVFVIND